MTYGSEAWFLDEVTAAAINGANARCLCRFTGTDVHEEVSKRTTSFDMVVTIRKRRLQWVGHILRMKGERLVKSALRRQFLRRVPDIMVMDLPDDMDFTEAEELAKSRAGWRKYC